LKENQTTLKTNSDLRQGYSSIIRNKTFLSYVSMFALLSCGEWCFMTTVPLLYKNTLHLNAEKIGFLMSLSAGFYILGTLLTNQLLKKISIDAVLRLGIKLSTAASILLLYFHWTDHYQALFISVTFGIYLLGASLLWGPTTSRALQCYETNRGAASAVRSLLLIGFFTLGSYLGTLIESNLLHLSIVMIFVSLASAKVYYSKPLANQRRDLREKVLIEV
jgi:predicted MFS family arabinose efflux permease